MEKYFSQDGVLELYSFLKPGVWTNRDLIRVRERALARPSPINLFFEPILSASSILSAS